MESLRAPMFDVAPLPADFFLQVAHDALHVRDGKSPAQQFIPESVPIEAQKDVLSG